MPRPWAQSLSRLAAARRVWGSAQRWRPPGAQFKLGTAARTLRPGAAPPQPSPCTPPPHVPLQSPNLGCCGAGDMVQRVSHVRHVRHVRYAGRGRVPRADVRRRQAARRDRRHRQREHAVKGQEGEASVGADGSEVGARGADCHGVHLGRLFGAFRRVWGR